MRRSVSIAFAWAGLEQAGRQCVRFVLSVLLARLLTPNDYGLMGMLLVFLYIAQAFVDSGLSAGLIQRKEIGPDDETSVLYINVAAGLLFTAILCAVSPLVAAFYHQPLLMPLLSASAVSVAIGSLGVVQNALLTRDMDFRIQAKVTMGSTLLSGLIGVCLAWRGWGVWSLVAQTLVQSLASVILVWKWSPWRPSGQFRWACVRRLWPFSWRMLASAQLNCIFENLYSIVIGKLYQPADLGFYTRASTMAMLPANSVGGMTQRVMFSVFSSQQDEKVALKQSFRKTVLMLSALFFPLMAGMAAVADPMVRCLLTEKWLPCVPYLQILCFSAMLYPLHALHLNLLMAQGRSDLFLRLEILKKALVVLALVMTSRLGVRPLVVSVLVVSLVSLVLNSYYTRRLVRYGWSEQIRDLLPMTVTSFMMAFAVWGLGVVVDLSGWVRLSVQVALGITLYGAISVLLRRHGYQEFWTIARRLWGRRLESVGSVQQMDG